MKRRWSCTPREPTRSCSRTAATGYAGSRRISGKQERNIRPTSERQDRGRSAFPLVVVVLVVLLDLRVFNVVQGHLGYHLEPHDVQFDLFDLPVIEDNLLLQALPSRHVHEGLRGQLVLDVLPLAHGLLESGPEDFQLAGRPGLHLLEIDGLSGTSLRIRADIDPGGRGWHGVRFPYAGRHGTCLL